MGVSVRVTIDTVESMMVILLSRVGVFVIYAVKLIVFAMIVTNNALFIYCFIMHVVEVA